MTDQTATAGTKVARQSNLGQAAFQLFPDLRPDEYEALKADIAERGVLVPIEVDQNGQVLDGHHRLKIAGELGIDAPTVQREFADDDARTAHVIALNLKRRQLDPVTWGEMAARYAIAKARDNVSLPLSVLAVELGVNEKKLDRRLAAARLPEPLREAVRENRKTVGTALQEHRRQGRIEAAEGVEQLARRQPPTTVETFQTLVVDPPWAYERDDIRGAAEHHYSTMTFEEIADYPIGRYADENAHLYLWVTNPHLPHVWRIPEAWGFEYKTMLTWVKPQIGTGHYFRGATEHVLFCVRGQLPLRDAGVPNWFEADRTQHSQKPESFYSLVERASYGPYVEFFARRQRDGWRSFGDELRL